MPGVVFVSSDCIRRSCLTLSGSWQVNGYVVNLFWSFDAHKQEKKTLSFRGGSALSHKGNKHPELRCVPAGRHKLDQCFPGSGAWQGGARYTRGFSLEMMSYRQSLPVENTICILLSQVESLYLLAP